MFRHKVLQPVVLKFESILKYKIYLHRIFKLFFFYNINPTKINSVISLLLVKFPARKFHFYLKTVGFFKFVACSCFIQWMLSSIVIFDLNLIVIIFHNYLSRL